jgi:hypothetical protein
MLGTRAGPRSADRLWDSNHVRGDAILEPQEATHRVLSPAEGVEDLIASCTRSSIVARALARAVWGSQNFAHVPFYQHR